MPGCNLGLGDFFVVGGNFDHAKWILTKYVRSSNGPPYHSSRESPVCYNQIKWKLDNLHHGDNLRPFLSNAFLSGYKTKLSQLEITRGS